jgi:Family of unknown function (DUF6508)
MLKWQNQPIIFSLNGNYIKQENNMGNLKKHPDEESFGRMAEFLDLFEEEGFVFGQTVFAPGQPPTVDIGRDAAKFMEALHNDGWFVDFEWRTWQDEAGQYVDDDEALKNADLDTIMKLLTTHAGMDSVCPGHLNSMYQIGHLTKILRRVKQLRD